MKNSETIQIRFTEMNNEELRNIRGGSFAYDAGRLLRYMGIYVYEGGGMRGTICAMTDFIANMVVNSKLN